MPTTPTQVTLTATSAEVLNVIRNNASQNYRDFVPVATTGAESVRTIGNVIMQYPALQNEFINSLVNRIAMVICTSRLYSNPWARFKKGFVDLGETIEEIFVELAKPFQYDPAVAESELFKREIPDVRTAFHIRNYTKFYKITVSRNDLKQAFLSWDGVQDLIDKIINSLYSAVNYDEFIVMKYLIARQILNGFFPVVTVPSVSTGNMSEIVSEIKGVSNSFEFMSRDYNLAGVRTRVEKQKQILIKSSKFDAKVSVEVLAEAFNMEKADFAGHQILVDGFGVMDNERLAELFADSTEYVELTDEECTALNAVTCVLCDEEYFRIYDNLFELKTQENGQGLYWNYYLHAWKTFSTSPFANKAVFLPATPSVLSVTVSPSTMTIPVGGSGQFTAVVETENFASQTVTWRLTNPNSGIEISQTGLVTLKNSGLAGSFDIQATSVFDNTVVGTAVVKIG